MCGEKIVIHIGNDRELIAGLELLEGCYRVGERQPVGEGFGQRTDLGLGRLESQAFAEAAHHGLQNFAVGMEILPARLRIRVRSRGVRSSDIGDSFAVRCEDGAKRGEDSCLPVDESAVTVKAEIRRN